MLTLDGRTPLWPEAGICWRPAHPHSIGGTPKTYPAAGRVQLSAQDVHPKVELDRRNDKFPAGRTETPSAVKKSETANQGEESKVEETQNLREGPNKAGHAGLAGLQTWERGRRLLGDHRKQDLHTQLQTKLAQAGHYSILDRYEFLRLYGRTAVCRTVRMEVREVGYPVSR